MLGLDAWAISARLSCLGNREPHEVVGQGRVTKATVIAKGKSGLVAGSLGKRWKSW